MLVSSESEFRSHPRSSCSNRQSQEDCHTAILVVCDRCFVAIGSFAGAVVCRRAYPGQRSVARANGQHKIIKARVGDLLDGAAIKSSDVGDLSADPRENGAKDQEITKRDSAVAV